MDAHPVPQNVTSFEFRLIGDMTLKQFIYLAIGAGTAYLFFVFLASPLPFLAWPVIIISTLLGVAFAFVPIAGRPLDHWSHAFLKAIYTPTKRSWQKNGKSYSENPLFNQRLSLFLSSQGSTPQIELTHLSAARASIPYSPSIPQPAPQPPPPPQLPIQEQPKKPESLPSTEELSKTVELAKKAQSIQVKILENQRELNRIKQDTKTPGRDLTTSTQEFNEIFNNLQKLVADAEVTKKELDSVTKTPEPLAPVKVTVVSPPKQKQTQLTLTTFPNVINGIIVDSQNNYLEAVVVVIHDKDGLPVRALKTNKLGQFTGSTPLPNGTYTIELEKDNLVFDILQIQLEGKVLPPLNISAKRMAGGQM